MHGSQSAPRILFLDHVGVLGGGELSLFDIARHFAATSKVLLFEDGPFRERLEAAAVPVEVVEAPASMHRVRREGKGLRAARSLPGVLKMVRRVRRQARGYDVLYANSQKAFVVAVLAGWLARRPVIWHLRDVLTADHFSPFHRRLVVLLANRWARRVLANSEATARAFVASGGHADRMHVVHNGIDPTPFVEVDPAAVNAVRRGLDLGTAPVVGVFSRLAPWKGQHVMLDALGALPGVHALLVGKALFGEETRYAASLHEQAAHLGIADRVHWLGFREDIPTLLHLVDVVVHTSIAPEPFGRVVVEGMLAGRPVVATRAGGVPEIIEDGVTGRLVEPGDARALAHAVDQVLQSPAEAHGMAEAGRAAAMERFTLARMLQAIEKHLDAVRIH